MMMTMMMVNLSSSVSSSMQNCQADAVSMQNLASGNKHYYFV